jgi:putative ABC transport system ATP-binding protein
MDGYIENENAYPDDEYIYNETFIGEDGEEYYYEEPLISLFDVVKEYDKGTVKALNGINLDIFEGEFVSIIGPSGSGKSTLLNMLGALDKPTRGKIYIDGIDLVKEKDLSQFRQEKIGFVFQLHNLIPNLSVFDNVQIPLLPTGMSNKEMKEKASEIIRAVGLEDKKKQRPNKLSGGQRQRVAIARALVNNPSIILADEPTGSLDSKTGEIILNLLMEMHERYNVTLIIVTHDNDVAALAERTIKIKDGQVIEDKYNY